MIMRAAALLCLLFLIAGCASAKRQEAADLARTQMIGMSKADLIACAGVPSGQAASGRTEALAYRFVGSSSSSTFVQAVPGQNAAFADTDTTTRWCEATFTLTDGKITSVGYRGKTGGLLANRQETCGHIVDQCVRR
jgi:hypothetical protein